MFLQKRTEKKKKMATGVVQLHKEKNL